MKYDKVFITSQPSFYKQKLWNEVAKRCRIFVIFTESSNATRNKDFYKGNILFEHTFVSGGALAQTNAIVKWFRKNEASELVFGGWDRLPSVIMSFLSPKAKNSTILESTIFESRTTGAKAIVKKLFMRRMSKAYAPGISNAKLAEVLGLKSNIVLTGGCGLLNYIEQPAFEPRKEVKNFVFVGRLIPVKNLEFLIRVFNNLPHLNLTIVGFGELEQTLKDIAKENVTFTGAIANEKLSEVYQAHDVFILPSKSETWGLVVEEALNNGLPIIVSDRVGCGADLATPETGLIFDYSNENSLREAVLKMTDVSFYNKLRQNVSKMDFLKRAEHQVETFCQSNV